MQGQPEPAAARAFELVPEAVVLVAADGRVEVTNRRACSLLGLPDDAAGRPWTDLVHLEDDAGSDCTASLLGGDTDPRVADRLAERVLRVRLGERRRPVAVAGRRLEDGGVVLTFRHAGRRERLDMARSDLVATVSHEIRSPLTSVKGFTRTMLAKWDKFSDEHKRTMLETINDDADRVTRLLTELLDVSRIDAGRVQLRRQIVDVRTLIRAVVDKVAHRPEGDERSVVLALPDDLPHVFADPDKVEQILTNLVENALKYAPDSDVRIGADVRDGLVHVSVADDGPGISEDQQRRIFQKFGRGRDNRRSGTGLGLYITRGLARAHGGDVWCEAVEGEGSTFHVTLPRTADDVEAVLDR